MGYLHALAPRPEGSRCRFVGHQTIAGVHMRIASIPKSNITSGEPGLELLRQRMKALQLDLAEVKRIERDIFRELAEACASCESKAECKKDPAVAPDAESTCV